jgi:hypothetical protein
MNNKYWDNFYKTHKFKEPSNFAKFCEPLLDNVVELGCGEGRDLNYFLKQGINAIGVDQSFEGDYILKRSVEEHLKKTESPDCVYTRFFWHAIDRKTQLKILRWTKGLLFIEARTIEDKPLDIFGKHKRHLVNTAQLIKDLKDNGFQIIYLCEGQGLSKYKQEDPFVLWLIASHK